MADGFDVEVDSAGLMAALAGLGDAAIPFVRAANEASALAIQAEMRARIARATGRTAEDILVSPFGTEGGFVVHTGDVVINFDTGESDGYYQDLHVALWLEKGTRASQGTKRDGRKWNHPASQPRPFFFASAALEEQSHEQRIADAIQEAIDAGGLGG